MHVGLPPDESFPLTSISATAREPGARDSEGGVAVEISDPAKVWRCDVPPNRVSWERRGAEKVACFLSPQSSNHALQVSSAQQYNFGHGDADLLAWVRGIVTRCHAPKLPFDVVISAGAVREGISERHAVWIKRA